MAQVPVGAAPRSHVRRLTQEDEMIAVKTSAPFVQLNAMCGIEGRMAYKLGSYRPGQQVSQTGQL